MQKPFRIWDSKQLSDTFVIAKQLKQQIEMLYLNLDTNSLKELPHSMIPSENLYEIVLGYTQLFDAVLDNDLLKSGNKKHSSSFH
jgi:hypothetical protein